MSVASGLPLLLSFRTKGAVMSTTYLVTVYFTDGKEYFRNVHSDKIQAVINYICISNHPARTPKYVTIDVC
jgi:hypothetical protein